MNELTILEDGRHRGHHTHGSAVNLRILELESENLRLQRLVAELLLKNQQLRREE